MAYVLHIVSTVVVLLLSAVQLCMLLRAILSWFMMESNRLTDFLYGVTEPFIYPVRLLFDRMGWFRNLPIDLSFMVTYLLLSLLMFFL